VEQQPKVEATVKVLPTSHPNHDAKTAEQLAALRALIATREFSNLV
jgi:hypothetical protein